MGISTIKRMSKKRTKEHKKKAQKLRTAPQVEKQPAAEKNASGLSYSFKASEESKLHHMPAGLTGETAQYIQADLIKTAVTATLLFTVLVGIYSYLRYN